MCANRKRFHDSSGNPEPQGEEPGGVPLVRRTICIRLADDRRIEDLCHALRRRGISTSKSRLLAEGIEFVEKKYRDALEENQTAVAASR